MHLIEILLPLRDRRNEPFPAQFYESLAEKLTRSFGGVTSFLRSPAEGRWHDGNSTEHDEIVVVEVMTDTIDRDWWRELRENLETQFDQDELLIRTHPVDRL